MTDSVNCIVLTSIESGRVTTFINLLRLLWNPKDKRDFCLCYLYRCRRCT